MGGGGGLESFCAWAAAVAFAFLDITSQAHRYMNTSMGSYKAGKVREGGK